MSEYMGQRKVSAECDQCGKRWEGANSQGVASQHARHHGHTVVVEILMYYVYDHNGKPVKKVKTKP